MTTQPAVTNNENRMNAGLQAFEVYPRESYVNPHDERRRYSYSWCFFTSKQARRRGNHSRSIDAEPSERPHDPAGTTE